VRITFERMADRRPVETVVERDDGVVFRMRGAGGGDRLPHDLVHALVEQSLRVTDGIWGCVADGVVWTTMRHASGRKPPHAADRSQRLKRERAARIQAAERLADLVERLMRGDPVLPGETRRAGFPDEALHAAAADLSSAAARWARLVPGDTWTLIWTPSPRRAGSDDRRRRRAW
jgi:hypothetical protein